MIEFELNELQGKKIVIYGAGVYGEIAYNSLKYLGISPKAFCDRYTAGQKYFDIEVIDLRELKEKYRDSLILIASAPYFADIRQTLEENNFGNIASIEKLMKLPIPNEWLSLKALEKKDNFELYTEAVKASECKDKLFLNHLEVVITERCNLRCKDCANLMQYYKNPENLDIDEIEKALDKLLHIVSRISELRILGGEPFVNARMIDIVNKYCGNEKIGKIVIYTNGTIVVSDKILNQLSNTNVEIHISDYNVKKSKIESLERKLQEYNIKYFTRQYDRWNRLGNLKQRNYDEEKIENMFQNCVMANCYSLYRGKLYRCPRAAHGQQLGVFCNSKWEQVDLLDEQSTDEHIFMRICEIINEKKALTACRYCNGSNWHEKGVPAAIQSDHVCLIDEE